ncbi:MAG: hypothetical protein U0939_22885 [Pirellulales bacterium]
MRPALSVLNVVGLTVAALVLTGCSPGAKPSGAAPAAPAANAPSANAAPAPPPAAVPAQVGVGAKGRSLDEHEGALVTPAKALFATKERVVFEVQLPQALQLYKAEHGQAPQSHDEYMQRIVAANSINLPVLPANRQYQYDPQTEQLMVVPTPQ